MQGCKYHFCFIPSTEQSRNSKLFSNNLFYKVLYIHFSALVSLAHSEWLRPVFGRCNTRVYTHVHTGAHTHTHPHTHTHRYTRTHLYTQADTCAYMQRHAHIHTDTHMNKHTQRHMCIHEGYTCTHTHTPIKHIVYAELSYL